MFLHESFKKLTTDQDEEFFFITGNEIDGVFVLDQWAEFAHQKRSMMGVTGDTRATHKLLIKLEQFGHRLLAHFHATLETVLARPTLPASTRTFSAVWKVLAMSQLWLFLVATDLSGSSGSTKTLKSKFMAAEYKNMPRASTVSQTSIRLKGKAIPGAEGRQRLIPGFDQDVYSKVSVCCVGAGGIISHIAPTLARKGIGRITLLDRDIVEPTNLNRQRFYERDLGKNKALALAENLQRECIAATEIRGFATRLEEAIDRGIDLSSNVAVCGVDNNPARIAASRFFRIHEIPVIFTAVSRDGDHGYVFVQDKTGPCIACLFPDMADDDRYPCPGTPAIADILQAVGALAVYSVDTLVMARGRCWNYRRISLSDESLDGTATVPARQGCRMFCSG